jgi:hypothetical protein
VGLPNEKLVLPANEPYLDLPKEMLKHINIFSGSLKEMPVLPANEPVWTAPKEMLLSLANKPV